MISSPLQALIVWILINTEITLLNKKVIIFCEGNYRLPEKSNIEYININNTRKFNLETFNENLKKINNLVDSKCILWISDVFWPLNNAIYTKLNKNFKLEKVNFFDEGMVLYWLEKLTAFRMTREFVKFISLRLKYRSQFTQPKIYPFYNNEKNGSVYALHAELLNENDKIKKINVDSKLISIFEEKLDPGGPFSDMQIYKGHQRTALLLSQPYYRVSNREDFKRILNNMAKYLKTKGSAELYVKLHPSEGIEIFKEFYEPIGFNNIFSDSISPIEAKLHKLPKNTNLISFNSSALLNARVFGFEGEIISYGLDWIASQYRFQKTIKDKQGKLFHRSGVEVIMDGN